MAQLSYSVEMATAKAGMLGAACGDDHDVLTMTAVDDLTIETGTAVAKEATDADGARTLEGSTDKIWGVAAFDPSLEEDEDNPGSFYYPQGWKVPVVSKGPVWVKVEEAVDPDDAVYVRFDGEVEVFTITFSADLITANVVNGSIGGEAIEEITFASDHDTTMAALAAAIEDLDCVATATCPGSGSRVITVTGATKGEDLSTGASFTVTLGASQATDTIANVTGPSAGTQSGVFRTDDDSTGNAAATAIVLSQARWLTTGSAGGLALLDLNLP